MAYRRVNVNLDQAISDRDVESVRWALLSELADVLPVDTDSRTKSSIAATMNSILKELPIDEATEKVKAELHKVDELKKRRAKRANAG